MISLDQIAAANQEMLHRGESVESGGSNVVMNKAVKAEDAAAELMNMT